MKCFRYFFLSFLFVGLLSCLFVKNVSAVSLSGSLVDYSENSAPAVTICSGGASVCDSYKYLIIEISGSHSVRGYFSLTSLRSNSQSLTYFQIPISSSYTVLDVSYLYSNSNFYSLSLFNSASISGSYLATINWTLSDELPSSCPPVEPCPDIPENPYDTKLDNITMAIYTCGGILLVLYFFYCIYRMIIKSSGVR